MYHPFEAEYKEVVLPKTWFFRLASLSFITLGVPLLAIVTRGVLGFVLLTYLAILAGLAEKSFGRVLQTIREAVAHNKWLVLCAVWYSIGVWLNIMLRGYGLADWRLMTGPVVLLITLCYALGVAHNDAAYRTFHIGLIVALGVQSLFTIRELSSAAGIAREMWAELQGAWEFGNQGAYASWIMLLPLFVWRALIEQGKLRLLLLGATMLVGAAASIGSFATPLMLLAIGSGVIIILALMFPVRMRSRAKAVILAIAFVAIGMGFYQYTRDNPLFAASYNRIENLLVDPQGGGYAGQDRAVSRWLLGEISIDSFLKAPWFGMGGGSIRYSPYVGGHSSVLDSLGAYGLLGGGGAFAGMLLTILIAAARRFFIYRSWETLLALTTIILLLVGGIANPYGDGVPLFLVLIMARPFSLLTINEKLIRLKSDISISEDYKHHSALSVRSHTY